MPTLGPTIDIASVDCNVEEFRSTSTPHDSSSHSMQSSSSSPRHNQTNVKLEHNENNTDDLNHHHPSTLQPNLPGPPNDYSSQDPPITEKKTRVDGKGLWRSWTRNFKTKLLALLDLIDNSLDAAIKGVVDDDDDENADFIGRVHISPDVHTVNGLKTTTGLHIINNCVDPIRPLKRVLEVYNSSKVDSGAGDIGENGVGLKQGCATLSDLSFVLVKNGDNNPVELGIIAESLQKVEGCYLPAFQFRYGDAIHSLKDQMKEQFQTPQNRDVAECLAQYGRASAESAPNLDVGIERLCQHFDLMCYKFYNNPYVFAVILDKVRHGKEQDLVGRALDNEQKVKVDELLEDLKNKIPRLYLHIPDSFDFRIRVKRKSAASADPNVIFRYWPARLVEFSSYTVKIGTKFPWYELFGKKDKGLQWAEYDLRIFLGFDAWRVTDPDKGKEASLFVYSRQSGRLIQSVKDARTLLGLTAGSSDFGSGLTILVDDIGGNLPLNPTKQEIAFGEQNTGEIHKENLYKWIGGVTHFYYQHHFKKFNKSKRVLTQKISDFGPQLLEFQQRQDKLEELKSCDSSELTTFELDFEISKRKKSIRAKSEYREIPGPDTIFRLVASPPKKEMSHKNQAKKRKHVTIDEEDSDPKRSNMGSKKSISATKNTRPSRSIAHPPSSNESESANNESRARRSSAPVSYDESESDSEAEFGDNGATSNERINAKIPRRKIVEDGAQIIRRDVPNKNESSVNNGSDSKDGSKSANIPRASRVQDVVYNSSDHLPRESGNMPSNTIDGSQTNINNVRIPRRSSAERSNTDNTPKRVRFDERDTGAGESIPSDEAQERESNNNLAFCNRYVAHGTINQKPDSLNVDNEGSSTNASSTGEKASKREIDLKREIQQLKLIVSTRDQYNESLSRQIKDLARENDDLKMENSNLRRDLDRYFRRRY